MIIQAGSSGDGKALVARTAEVIFTAQNHLESAQEFYQSIKEQAPNSGVIRKNCNHAGDFPDHC